MDINSTDSKSDIITFDAIFELVRNEKTKDELIKTNPIIYDQLINYLKSKLEIYKNVKNNEYESEKIKTQINNARKLIKDWYERREYKILILAMAKSRLKNIDETNFLPEEKLMLNELTEILNKYRQSILLNLINLKKPLINSIEKNNIEKETIKNQETFIEKKTLEKNSETLINNEKKDLDNKESNQKIKLKIYQDLPKIVDSNLNSYGPFKANEIIELPKELADVIIYRKIGEKTL
ncbi:MAG: hypothetical protein QXM96_01860 [Candidatus Woesearchaeota archaeon]